MSEAEKNPPYTLLQVLKKKTRIKMSADGYRLNQWYPTKSEQRKLFLLGNRLVNEKVRKKITKRKGTITFEWKE